MSRQERKMEHVNLAKNTSSITPNSDFDAIRLVHRSFPETSVDEVSLMTSICSIEFLSPIYINAMTGGSHETGQINEAFAKIARATGMAMAVGSQHAGIRDPQVAESYRIVRRVNPSGIVMANIGAGAPPDYAKKAVDMLEAQLLQVHVNAPQELVMPEGDRDFHGWLKNVERMVQLSPVPVIVKEVGFGISRETIRQLRDIGVTAIDVGGRGGTDFTWIENQRRADKTYDYLRGWGLSTVTSLLESHQAEQDMAVCASGGIRHPLDALKSFALGASAVGIAGPVLRSLLHDGVEQTISMLQSWQAELRTLMTMVGATSIPAMSDVPLVILGDVKTWCDVRGIDVTHFARRGQS
ncbi:type 2 isopentenyl-diphosphate Delta-isomerase [Alicyclobacillus dauci]|uniref:Isopentenyl-diphosphate delta-isomerase n=1 Tax=Alicyclobacillus dauci TaxID=1475485 RepID=A0ABY6Z5A1_9BACL|nr:type 2 isopentenyl-diphosphate Delta-isomerase [Alicyclobacillus dauci]WAH37828.1 type 2 isopentenyl-diphosphate Delta-isomerase [Alicyclobacillus dauci]